MYLIFLFLFMPSRFSCSNFYFVLGLCAEFFFFFLLTCCLSFCIGRSSFLRSSWLGCRFFFSCLWSWVLYFPCFLLHSGALCRSFFLFLFNLLLVFQYLAFFSPLFLVEVPQMSLELSSLLSVVFYFGRGCTVFFLRYWSWDFYCSSYVISLTHETTVA